MQLSRGFVQPVWVRVRKNAEIIEIYCGKLRIFFLIFRIIRHKLYIQIILFREGGKQVNFIQKNPNDPRYTEFHDGEYEYWPVEASVKTKSISFPAALLSGLELLAAAAAAALLTLALSTLYITSAPRSVTDDSAVINANVYNNHSDHTIRYFLYTASDPDTFCQEGVLEDDESTLFLMNLNGGTDYLLKYLDPDQNEVGQFRFTTTGEYEQPENSEPEKSEQQPPKPADDAEPGSETDTSAEDGTESAESTTEPGTEPAEDTAEPNGPNNRPPVIVNPRPTPRPEEEEEENQPETTPPAETKPNPGPPAPDPGPPDMSGFIAEEFISGVFDNGDVGYTQFYVFRNVPDNKNEIVIEKTGNRGYIYETEYSDGVLTVAVSSALIHGETVTTKVTVHTSAGTVSKESTIFPPRLAGVNLDVAEKDGAYTFTITADVEMNDGSAVTDGMVLSANLIPYMDINNALNNPVVSLPMEQVSSDLSRYTATYTTAVPPGWTKAATVSVTGCWDTLEEDVFRQTVTDAIINY